MGFHERPLVFETKSIMAAMSVGGKSLGNLQCWKLHLSPNLQASFVSRNDAQYCCERPGGKKQFLVRNVYNGASKGCLGSICFATITRLLLLSVIVIGEADIAITSFATIPPRVSTGTTTKDPTKIMIGVRLMMMVRREIDVATRKQGAEGCEGSRGTSKKILLGASCNAELKLLQKVLHD